MYFFQKNIIPTTLVHCYMQLQVMCNSILLTLEALINLLKEIKTIGKNLGKIRAREGGERADQGKVVVDA